MTHERVVLASRFYIMNLSDFEIWTKICKYECISHEYREKMVVDIEFEMIPEVNSWFQI
jgi:hypothetical protein